MDSQFQEFLQNKKEFEVYINQKKSGSQLGQIQNSTKQEKLSHQSKKINKDQQQQKIDSSFQNKTLEYIQKIESCQGGLDKMMYIKENQARFINVLIQEIEKTNKRQHKRNKSDKILVCRACPNQKHFANKYTLKRHMATMHNTTDKQNINIDSKDQNLLPRYDL